VTGFPRALRVPPRSALAAFFAPLPARSHPDEEVRQLARDLVVAASPLVFR
jgi:hypothetical protein